MINSGFQWCSLTRRACVAFLQVLWILPYNQLTPFDLEEQHLYFGDLMDC